MSHIKVLNNLAKITTNPVNRGFIIRISEKYKHKITVSEYIIERLLEKNVTTAFGYIGGEALPFFDSISRNDNFNMIFNRHEQCSGHAAQAYGKVTNNIGVVVTTSGPGFTNVVTPLYDAYSDGNALLCISAQLSSYLIGTESFQECDATAITKTCVKDNHLIKTEIDFPNIFEYMINLAERPRRGPVHLDICKDVFLKDVIIKDIYIKETTNADANADANPNDITDYDELKYLETLYKKTNLLRTFDKLHDKIIRSKRPVVIVGAGAVKDYELIRAFSKKYAVPVVTTLHGLGVVDEYDALSLKMFGAHGSYHANMAVQNADLLIGIGNRFDDRTVGLKREFALMARSAHGIVHIDNSKEQIRKVQTYIEPTMSIQADTETVVTYLNNMHTLETYDWKRRDIDAWRKTINNWKQSFQIDFDNTIYGTTFSSNYIIEILSVLLKNKADYFLTTGVGSHQMIVAKYFNHRHPGRLITSGSFGTMGTGLPFAIGAQIASPKSQVILIDGDGGFTMSSNDIATIIEYNLPIKIFIMNDRKLKMADLWQEMFYENRKLGAVYGIKSYFCDNKYFAESTLSDALKHDGPAIVNFKTDGSYCLPFVAPNTPLDKMVIT